jgi:hypothetical protein
VIGDIAAGNFTNAGLESAKPVTQAARIMVLSQGAVDWVFVVVIIAVAVTKMTGGASSASGARRASRLYESRLRRQ